MAQQIAQAQQNVKGAKAIGHEHFRMGDAPGEAVGQKQNLRKIGGGAQKIGDGFQGVAAGNGEQRNQEQQNRQPDGNVACQKEGVLQAPVAAVGENLFFGKALQNVMQNFFYLVL